MKFDARHDPSPENRQAFVTWLVEHTVSRLQSAKRDTKALKASVIHYLRRTSEAGLSAEETAHIFSEGPGSVLSRAALSKTEKATVLHAYQTPRNLRVMKWLTPFLANTVVAMVVVSFLSSGDMSRRDSRLIFHLICLFCSLMALLQCLMADAIRKRLSWSRWMICPVMVLLSVGFAAFLWLVLPQEKSGLRSLWDVLCCGCCIIFLPCITFGFVFTLYSRDVSQKGT